MVGKQKNWKSPFFSPPYINKGLINNVQPLFFKAKFSLPLDKGLKLCHSSDLTKNCPNYFKICAVFGQVSTIFYEFAASPHLSPCYLPCLLESPPYNYDSESRIMVTKNIDVLLEIVTSEGAFFGLSILHPILGRRSSYEFEINNSPFYDFGVQNSYIFIKFLLFHHFF